MSTKQDRRCPSRDRATAAPRDTNRFVKHSTALLHARGSRISSVCTIETASAKRDILGAGVSQAQQSQRLSYSIEAESIAYPRIIPESLITTLLLAVLTIILSRTDCPAA